ncbi:ATP-binding protein [Deinococcus hopiensis]|uniref:histidine kinase n=1 Tax=Deinococcus hopiensis KR-140 TaxID=695939 RepID=A0A1W1UT42_9DEIO|nr:ATP-binding protein [Deinococcus hopiensis]SMB83884.1 Tetratricopeptide repeat-containing protein [Deinococcus hopiensis KR-140]
MMYTGIPTVLANDTSGRISQLLAQADPLVVSDVQAAMALTQEAMRLAADGGHERAYGQALCLYGATLFFQSRYDDARAAYTEARTVSRALADAGIESRAVNGLGIIARALGDYAATMEAFMTSAQLARAHGDQLGELRALSNMALLHNQLGDHGAALSMQREVMAGALAAGQRVLESSAGVNAVAALHALGDHAAALALADERLEVTAQLGLQEHQVLLRMYRARSLLGLAQPDAALRETEGLLDWALGQGNANNITLLLLTVGRAHAALGAHREARESLERALDLSRESSLRPREVEALQALSELAAAQGEHAQAYTHLLAYHTLETQLRTETVEHKVKVMSVQQQLEHLQREAVLTRARAEELEARVAERTLDLQRVNTELSVLTHSLEAQVEERTRALKDSQVKLLAMEKLASLGRLTAGLAHEINTPLASVMGIMEHARTLAEEYRESIGHGGVTDDDHREIANELLGDLQQAGQGAARIGEFIRNMRGHTRNVASGAVRIDLPPLISDTLAMLVYQAREMNVALNFTPAQEGCAVNGEPGRFTQVLTNLVLNGMHAASGLPGAQVTVDVACTQKGVVLSVQDNGCGIADDVLPNIFDPLFTTREVGQGTGLGLSIVHDIITGHFSGEIDVITEVGVGTTMRVTLPGA